jgi:dUTP pyrophosphatase
MIVKIKKLNLKAIIPTRMHDADAGCDLCACIDEEITISPNGSALIPTGIAIHIPEGHEGQIRPRSGLAAKYKVTVLNAPGTVDSGFLGEIKVILINHNCSDKFVITNGMRIAQLIIAKCEKVDFELVSDLDETDRNTNGFGSTGI